MMKPSGGIVRKCTEFLLVFTLVICGNAENENGNCIAANGQEGRCVPLNECPLLHSMYTEIINGNASSDTSQEFERSFCLDRLLLCCPASEPPTTPVTRTYSAQAGEFLLPKECGVRALGDRIVNGQDASLYSWPWIVLLRGRGDGRRFWFCGGSLISDRYVLTAAHCFTEKPNLKLEIVRIGEHDTYSDIDCENHVCAPPVQDITVEDIILHPRHKESCTICNDIALLRLSRAASMHSPFVNSICLPLSSDASLRFSNQNLEGTSVWAAGWGVTHPDNTSPASVLQEVKITIQDNGFCRVMKSDNPNGSTAFCAGGDGSDTCKGDSGGPITVTSPDSLVYLVGITSAGSSKCGSRNTLGIYINVYEYVPWILSNMKI
ncbi:CLIP domain-containing serine protease B4-like [Macrobrachium nipponense]|uniref:CLIP domain-containing serine protease B4-like n=1 Tax=Macrobrachium nipponense TaxID=159736 RepID=UPI0030C7AF86